MALHDPSRTTEEHEQLIQLAIELRELLFDDASAMMRGAMVGSPVECVAFAKWWIQRQKGLTPDQDWFVKPSPGDEYCLGNGELGCDGCKKEKVWQHMNSLEAGARMFVQKQMTRIDDAQCMLAGRPHYESE